MMSAKSEAWHLLQLQSNSHVAKCHLQQKANRYYFCLFQEWSCFSKFSFELWMYKEAGKENQCDNIICTIKSCTVKGSKCSHPHHISEDRTQRRDPWQLVHDLSPLQTAEATPPTLNPSIPNNVIQSSYNQNIIKPKYIHRTLGIVSTILYP